MADEHNTLMSYSSKHIILPFVHDATKSERRSGMPSRDFWSVASTGDYLKDRELGQRYARAALDYIDRHDLPVLLPWTVRDMARRGGNFTGIESGFLSIFSRHAVAALRLIREASR